MSETSGSDGIFKVSTDGIYAMKSATEKVQTSLQESYETSKRFFYSISPRMWSGKAKTEFMAFYHLLLQYHGCLAGIDTAGYEGGGGYTVSYESLKEMAKALDNFHDKLLNYASSNNFRQLNQ